jgi:hypothetical protein
MVAFIVAPEFAQSMPLPGMTPAERLVLGLEQLFA